VTLDPLYRAIGYILAVFYVPFHSLGLAIILLTLVIMLIQFPLTAKQARSMIQMQRVQPEIKKIQAKYKDDKAKQNEELLKFYQENKINPLAGCLPILITIPIGMAMFRTFSLGVQTHIPKTGGLGRLYQDLCANHLDSTKKCGEAITDHAPSAMRFLGMSLNLSATHAHGFPTVLPYYVLVGLVVLTGWYQMKQTQARQLQSGNAAPNAQMQAMTKVFPVIFGVVTIGINAGATLYFVVSNIWRIGQQHLVIGKMYDQAIAAGDLKVSKDSAPPKKPADDPPKDADGNGARPRNRSGGARNPSKTPPGTKRPPPKGQNGKIEDAKSSGPNGSGDRQGMTPGARRKKKRKR
jgi:YidC/Oxa1 family membrane protein insertase